MWSSKQSRYSSVLRGASCGDLGIWPGSLPDASMGTCFGHFQEEQTQDMLESLYLLTVLYIPLEELVEVAGEKSVYTFLLKLHHLQAGPR